MTKFEEQLTDAGKQITMTTDEVALMRDRLERYSDFVRVQEKQPEGTLTFAGEVVSLMPRRMFAGTLVATFLLMTTGISFAAEGAVPGEALYPVKVHVNEEIISALTIGSEAQTEWELERVERRLEEVTTLASRGELTPERSEEVRLQLDSQVARATEAVDGTDETDVVVVAKVSSQLENTLDAHETILVSFAVENDAQSEEVELLASVLRKNAKNVAMVRQEAEEMIAVTLEIETDENGTTTEEVSEETLKEQQQIALSAKETAQHALRTAENRAKRQELLEGSVNPVVSGRLAIAQEYLQEGDTEYGNDNFLLSYRAYNRATGIADRLVAFMDAKETYQIDAFSLDILDDASSTTETSVKVFDMESESLIKEQEEVTALLETLTAQIFGLPEGTTEEVREQLRAAHKRARALIVRAHVAQENNDIEDAVSYLEAARVIIETAQAIAPQSDPVVVEPKQEESVTVKETTEAGILNETIEIGRQFDDGVHTYSGWVTVSAACIQPLVEVTEDSSKIHSLRFTLQKDDGDCTVQPTTKPFSASLEGIEEARITRVFVDSKSVFYKVTYQEAQDDFFVTEESAELDNENDKSERSFAYPSTPKLLEDVLDGLLRQ